MNAVEIVDDNDRATEVTARVTPNRWIEAYPCTVEDAGDVGGDVQAGPAWSRRFVQWLPARGLWAVLTDSFYLAECDHDEDTHEVDSDGEPRCQYCGSLRWVENQTELLICRDFRDPGGTEVASQYAYDNQVAAFVWQETDAYARACAERLRAEHYGEPSI